MFDVNADGSIGNGRTFYELQGEEVGHADGMKVDVQGNLYRTGPAGVHVIAPDGTLLGRLKIPAECTNLAFGDDDWRSLYITTHHAIYRARSSSRGSPSEAPMRAEIERIAGPFAGAAGGVAWDGARVLFSVVGESRVMSFDPATGEVAQFRRLHQSGQWHRGRSGRRGLWRAGGQPAGHRVRRRRFVAADAEPARGKFHNFPTDLTVDSKGRIWFADPYNPLRATGPQIFPPLDHASVLRASGKRPMASSCRGS